MYANLADSESDEAHKRWIETRGRLIKAFDPPEEVEQADEMSDDEFWEQALEEEFAKDNPDPAKKPAKVVGSPPNMTDLPPQVYEPDLQEIPQGRVDAQGWTYQEAAPNLDSSHQDIHIQADDDVPDDA